MSLLAEKYKTTAALPAIVPVFPLPGALLLPRGILPLNIFEPRYMAMVDHALQRDRVIGMIQPKSENEPSKLQHVGCLGRLSAFQETDDGRYLITLTGICRYVIEEHLSTTTPFDMCQINAEKFESDLHISAQQNQIDREGLLKAFASYLDANNLEVDWDSLSRASDETLVNAFCMMSPYGLAEKQAFLEADCLRDRADLLIAITERDLVTADRTPGQSLQ